MSTLQFVGLVIVAFGLMTYASDHIIKRAIAR